MILPVFEICNLVDLRSTELVEMEYQLDAGGHPQPVQHTL